MALDPSIYANIQAPKITSPFENAQQALTIQNLISQSQFTPLQRQMMLQKAQAEAGHLEAQTAQANAIAQASNLKSARDSLASVAPGDVAGMARHIEFVKKLFGPDAASGMSPDIVNDPNFLSIKAQKIMGAEDALARLSPKLENRDIGGSVQSVNPYTNQVVGETKKTLTPESALPKIMQTPSGLAAVSPYGTGGSLIPARQNQSQQQTQNTQPGSPQTISQPSSILGAPNPGIKYQEQAASKMADYEAGLNSRVEQGGDLMMRIAESRDALSKTRAGGGAEARAYAARQAQAIGASQDVVDKIAGGDLGAAQEFQKLAVQQAMEQLKQALATGGSMGGSRITQAEFKVFQQNNPNLTTDPRAIEKIYNFATKVYQRDRSEQEEFNKFKTSGKDITTFPNYWQGNLEKQGIVKPVITDNASQNKSDSSLQNAQPAKTFDSMPDPASLDGKRIKADDGTIYKSIGGKWVRQ